jgi:SAM-dependent methyltransferase
MKPPNLTPLPAVPAAGAQTYDRIGGGYTMKRQADPRIARAITAACGPARTIVNVGAGSGSYEPADRAVVAVEPALTMLRQRSGGAGPAVRGLAGALPFRDGAFDAALAVLTIHHWGDWRAGVHEMARVARQRLVIFTWDPTSDGFWLGDYLPGLLVKDRPKFPDPRDIVGVLPGAVIEAIPIPHDCRDGFLGAYWRRPAAYLDPAVRAAISSLAGEDAGAAAATGLDQLAEDVASGAWARKYNDIQQLEALDVGYRLVSFTAPA